MCSEARQVVNVKEYYNSVVCIASYMNYCGVENVGISVIS